MGLKDFLAEKKKNLQMGADVLAKLEYMLIEYHENRMGKVFEKIKPQAQLLTLENVILQYKATCFSQSVIKGKAKEPKEDSRYDMDLKLIKYNIGMKRI